MASTGIRYQIISIAWQVLASISNNKHGKYRCQISNIKYSMASTDVRDQLIGIAWQVSMHIYQGQVTNMSVRVTTSIIMYQPIT